MNSTAPAMKSFKPMMTKNIKDENLKRVRRFCRMLERNLNSYYNSDYLHDINRQCKGFFLKIDSINGIKKIWPNNIVPQGRKFYIRFFMTFYNQQTSQFIGNTYKSPLLKITFNKAGHYELDQKDPLYVYFLSQPQSNYNQGGKVLYDQCAIEIIFVETNESDYVLAQNCEGWGVLNIVDNSENPITKSSSTGVYLGSCRQLLHKGPKTSESYHTINGASILFSCSGFKEIERVRCLIPNYFIFGSKDAIPGLLLNYLPIRPILNETIKLVEFYDIYMKNVEIEINYGLESQLIHTAKLYRKQKLEITDDNFLSPIAIKERKLRCGVHNTFCFINTKGMDSLVSLSSKENFLIHKGVHHIDNFFQSENCALIFELVYTLSIPLGKSGALENLDFILGYLIFVPAQLDSENNFRTGAFITGPGMTVYGEHMFELNSQEEKIIKMNFILSKNKETFEKTHKENEVEEIKAQMEQMRKSLIDDYNRKLGSKDKEMESILKKQELEIEGMDQKLRESQKELKTLYDKEDYLGQETKKDYFSITQMNSGNFANTQFVFAESLEKAEQRLVPEENEELNRRVSKFPTIKAEEDKVYSNSYNLKQPLNFNLNLNSAEEKSQLNHSLNVNNINSAEEKSQRNNSINEYIQNESTIANDFKGRTSQLINSENTNLKNNERYYDEHDNNQYDENYTTGFNKYNSIYNKTKQYKEEPIENDSGKNSSHHPKIIYDQTPRDISKRDRAELIAKGLISLDINEKSENLLSYTFEKELTDEKKAYNFVFHFLSYKPNNNIKDYKNVPNKIFFKFNFWDFENFSTSVAVVSKPNSTIAPTSIPLILQRENSALNAKSEDKQMKVEITYDPSDEPYMDFKDFIEYLLNKHMFVEVYDAEKLMYLGYCKIPLRELLRQGRQSVFQTKEFEIYDEQDITKGAIQILLKSNGMKTNKTFDYDISHLKVINTRDKNNTVQKKKKVKSNAIDIQKISQEEKEYIAKTILSKQNEKNSSNEEVKAVNSFALKIDKDTEKKIRVMKYANQSIGKNLSFPEEKLQQYQLKQEKEMEFYKTLNYVNRIKEFKRNEVLTKTIQEYNKNSLNISLILGQPFYNNFVIHNPTEEDELLHLVITKAGDEKNPGDNSTSDHSVRIVSRPEEWRYVTEKYKLIRPNDYQSISQNYLIVKSNESIPILIKILSFDEKTANSNYIVWVYKKNGQPLYFLSITIVKVFPVIDHAFRYHLPQNRYVNVKFPNPFKFEKSKTQKVMDNYICTDVTTIIALDPESNDFCFKAKIMDEGLKNYFYLLLYLDSYQSNLIATWKFELNSIAK